MYIEAEYWHLSGRLAVTAVEPVGNSDFSFPAAGVTFVTLKL